MDAIGVCKKSVFYGTPARWQKHEVINTPIYNYRLVGAGMEVLIDYLGRREWVGVDPNFPITGTTEKSTRMNFGG